MHHFFLYKNVNVHYTVSGKGKAVVLLHGFLENCAMWNLLSKTLSKKYRVVCIDLFGHGSTGNYGYIHTMEDQASLVKAVLSSLRLRKYVLVGHSMGGYIALAFAKLFPHNLKGLCLMNSTALSDSEEKKVNRDRAVNAVKQDYKTFIRIAVPMLFSEKNRPVFTKEIHKIVGEAILMTPGGIIAALEGMKIREDLTAVYKKASHPIQMIIGKQDPVLEFNSLVDQTKNTKVQTVVFPDGHMSHIENTGLLRSTLEIFIRICHY